MSAVREVGHCRRVPDTGGQVRCLTGVGHAEPVLAAQDLGGRGGASGPSRFEVAFERSSADGGWVLVPVGRASGTLQLWGRYSREQIPGLFGLEFSEAVWNSGFVSVPGHLFLLVTLDKSGKGSDFQYKDRFLSAEVFQWESQNRTTQAGKHGQLIRGHRERETAVHLFVRATGKVAGRGSAPFVYCGDVGFENWEGERPITVRWRLAEAVPGRLREELGVPAS